VNVHPEAEISFLVWTTTPWTIPLNRALVLNPTGNYVLLYMRWSPAAAAAKSSADAATGDKKASTTEQEERLKPFFDRQYLEKQSSALVLVGEELAQKLSLLFKCHESTILACFPAIFFERSTFKVQHPLVDGLEVRTHSRTIPRAHARTLEHSDNLHLLSSS
jgi:isoleucyl-tRNA synthetase